MPEEEEEISTPDFIHQSEPELGEHRPFFSLKNDPFYDIRDESDEMTLEEEPQDLTYSSLKLDMEKQVKNNMPLAHPADALFKIDEEHPSFINTPSPEPVFQENVQNDPVKKESELKTLFAKAKGNILILSIEDVFRKNLVNVLTKNKTITSKSQNSEFADIDYGTIEFKSNKLLNIISFSLEKEFGPLMEFFSKNSLGYLLLVDTNKINWRYYNYLLKVLNDKLKLPSTIVIQTHGNTDITEEKIKQKLELKPNTTLQIVNTLEYKSAKRLIFSLFKPFYTPPKTPVLKEAINHSTL